MLQDTQARSGQLELDVGQADHPVRREKLPLLFSPSCCPVLHDGLHWQELALLARETGCAASQVKSCMGLSLGQTGSPCARGAPSLEVKGTCQTNTY